MSLISLKILKIFSNSTVIYWLKANYSIKYLCKQFIQKNAISFDHSSNISVCLLTAQNMTFIFWNNVNIWRRSLFTQGLVHLPFIPITWEQLFATKSKFLHKYFQAKILLKIPSYMQFNVCIITLIIKSVTLCTL